MMENLSFLDGLMVKSEHFCLNQVNYSMSSMMPITMDVLLSLLLTMEKESFQVELKDKSESGRSPSKLKLWKCHSKNIEAEFGVFKLAKIVMLLFQLVVMDLVFYGI